MDFRKGVLPKNIFFTGKAAPPEAPAIAPNPADEEERLIMESFPFSYVVLDGNRIVLARGLLEKVFENGGITRIPDVVPSYDCRLSKQMAVIGGKNYALFTKPFQVTTDGSPCDLCAVFFLETESAENVADGAGGIIVGLIFIDNFEEALDGMEEARRPMLAAVIDRKIGSLAQQSGGIVKKFEKDKYIFIFTAETLERMKECKFDILAQIREIDMGNKMPVTLSVGIGTGGRSLYKNMEYARAAIDLALGRGGDQALVKDAEKYTFFGGVSKEFAANARVRARVKAFAFAALVEESENVIVLGHKNTDLDSLGAAVGVCKIVTAMGHECNIVLDEVTSSIKYLHQRLVAEPEYSERVFVTTARALEKTGPKTLVVVVDTHRPALVAGVEVLRAAGDKKAVVFDHHRKSAEFIDNAVLVYHEPYASSTSELITEMLQYTKNEFRLKPVEADALLAGITMDTKNFAIKTGAKTFEAAAYLRRMGADSVKVKLLLQNDLESFKARAAAVNSAQMYFGNMAIAVSPSTVENPQLTAAQVADELLNIHGVEASFVLCFSNNEIFISARSLGSINVQVIMEKLGGGGHQTVAGVQLPERSADDLEDAVEALTDAIDEYLRNS